MRLFRWPFIHLFDIIVFVFVVVMFARMIDDGVDRISLSANEREKNDAREFERRKIRGSN